VRALSGGPCCWPASAGAEKDRLKRGRPRRAVKFFRSSCFLLSFSLARSPVRRPTDRAARRCARAQRNWRSLFATQVRHDNFSRGRAPRAVIHVRRARDSKDLIRSLSLRRLPRVRLGLPRSVHSLFVRQVSVRPTAGSAAAALLLRIVRCRANVRRFVASRPLRLLRRRKELART